MTLADREGSGGPQGGDTGGVKKTSPMKGKVFFTGDTHTRIHTHGHRDSMTESAQWADSVKTKNVLGRRTKRKKRKTCSASVWGWPL